MPIKKGLNKGLGKGLGALLPDDAFGEQTNSQGLVQELKITQIEPNPSQPRSFFDTEKLEVLADSIRQHGILQPIVVRKNSAGLYTIIAGERRWRAAKLAKLQTIPVIIKDYTNQTVMEVALIENLQREDLNPIEEAVGYKALMEGFELTQEQISQKVGKSRSAVANSLRLLNLEASMQGYLISGELTSGHARAILSLASPIAQLELAGKIIEEGLNVRQAEVLAKRLSIEKKNPEPKMPTQVQLQFTQLEDSLSSRLGTKVKITHGKNKGKIEIEYYSDTDLERLLDVFNKN